MCNQSIIITPFNWIFFTKSKVKVKISMARSLPVENLLPQNEGSVIYYLHSNLLKYPNRDPLVTVDHNQLLTMASETVDPIDWSYPPTLLGNTPWAPRIARCKCGPQISRLAAATMARTRVHGDARPTHYLCGHSWYVFLQHFNIK